MSTFYDVLELNREEIERDDELSYDQQEANVKVSSAYRRLARAYHPDRNPSNPQATVNKFQEISTAFCNLKDKNLRINYRQQIGPGARRGVAKQSSALSVFKKSYEESLVLYNTWSHDNLTMTALEKEFANFIVKNGGEIRAGGAYKNFEYIEEIKAVGNPKKFCVDRAHKGFSWKGDSGKLGDYFSYHKPHKNIDTPVGQHQQPQQQQQQGGQINMQQSPYGSNAGGLGNMGMHPQQHSKQQQQHPHHQQQQYQQTPYHQQHQHQHQTPLHQQPPYQEKPPSQELHKWMRSIETHLEAMPNRRDLSATLGIQCPRPSTLSPDVKIKNMVYWFPNKLRRETINSRDYVVLLGQPAKAAAREKSKNCRFMKNSGKCRMGDKCNFNHDGVQHVPLRVARDDADGSSKSVVSDLSTDIGVPCFDWGPRRGHKKILIVGGTGHGKSTFINSLHNYFNNCTMDQIEVVIPTAHLRPCGKANHSEAGGSGSESQTQACTNYKFTSPINSNTPGSRSSTPLVWETRVVRIRMMPT
jgi:hypothetical protein